MTATGTSPASTASSRAASSQAQPDLSADRQPVANHPLDHRLRDLGSVAGLAARWQLLDGRLDGAAALTRGFAACMAANVSAGRRMRTRAGSAWPGRRLIMLHPDLLRPGHEVDRDQTFLHECAHLIADLEHGRPCGHDARWRAVMLAIGEVPATTHRIDYLQAAAQARVIWRCTGCGRDHAFVRRPRRALRSCHCRACGPERGRLIEIDPAAVPPAV